MEKNLAIDANDENYYECIRYSAIIREMFGNKTFIFKHLQEAIYNLPNTHAQALNQKFHFFDSDEKEEDFRTYYFQALKKLAESDAQYCFLTQTYINYLTKLDILTLNSDLKQPNIDLIPIKCTPLPARCKNALTKYGVNTISDLRALTLKQISDFRNIGTKSANEIQQIMYDNYGIILV